MKTHFSCFQNSYSVTQWQVCNIAEIVGPKSQALSHPTGHSLFSFFFFFPFFSTFLSFSLLLYLFFFVFFFRAKSSYSLNTHTGHSHADHSHADPRRPKLRDHQLQSSITRRKAPPCAHSPHRYYRTRSSIWSEHRNRHPQQRRISVGNNWKRFDLEAYSSI